MLGKGWADVHTDAGGTWNRGKRRCSANTFDRGTLLTPMSTLLTSLEIISFPRLNPMNVTRIFNAGIYHTASPVRH